MAAESTIEHVKIATMVLVTKCMQDHQQTTPLSWRLRAAQETFNCVMNIRERPQECLSMTAFRKIVRLITTDDATIFEEAISTAPLLPVVIVLPPIHSCIYCSGPLPVPTRCRHAVTYIDKDETEYPAVLFETDCDDCAERYTASYHFSTKLDKTNGGWQYPTAIKKLRNYRAYYSNEDLSQVKGFRRRTFEATPKLGGRRECKHYVLDRSLLIAMDVHTERESSGAMGYCDKMKFKNVLMVFNTCSWHSFPN
jgi:hypothetical protein